MTETAIIALYAIKYGVEAAAELQQVFTKDNPTQDDWGRVWAKSSKDPDTLIKEAAARLGVPVPPGSVSK